MLDPDPTDSKPVTTRTSSTFVRTGAARRPSRATLLDLIDAVWEVSATREEAAAVVNHLLQTGRVRLAE